MIFTITDDSGFMGIANFNRYNASLSGDWNFGKMVRHLIKEMNSNHLLFWATGEEGHWRIKVVEDSSDTPAFREHHGYIEVTDGRLYLTNYEDLTIATRQGEFSLPQRHNAGLYLILKNGLYNADFKQLRQPEIDHDDKKDLEFDFEIVLTKLADENANSRNSFTCIPWLDY